MESSYPTSLFLPLVASFLLALVASCATLPHVGELEREKLPHIGEIPEIVGPAGKLPIEQTKSLLRRFEWRMLPAEDFAQHLTLMEKITGEPFVAGNHVDLLVNGREAFPAMLEAISNARSSINFETFIFSDDAIGRQFAAVLAKKAAEGVEVRLLYDNFGSLRTPSAFFSALRDRGVKVVEFNALNPFKPHRLERRLNYRDHRKLLIVDGNVAFAGGINISQYYGSGSMPSAGGSLPWRDTHVRITGPAVSEFQSLFLQMWAVENGPEAPDRKYFPYLEMRGKALLSVLGNTPGERNRLSYVAYVSAINRAKYSVYITAAYFIPTQELRESLMRAAKRGVDVRIVLPGPTDSKLALYAGRYYYEELLSAGVKLYTRKGEMLHAKTAVIDGIWSLIGSTNLDLRSALFNYEINALILCPQFGNKMEDLFATDIAFSDEITLPEWSVRPAGEKFKERHAHLLSRWL